MRYFRLNSLTWWAGAFLIFVGVLQSTGVPNLQEGAQGVAGGLAALASALAGLTGGLAPEAQATASVGLISTGLGFIGAKDHMHRERIAAERRHEMLVRLIFDGQMEAALEAAASDRFEDADFDDEDDDAASEFTDDFGDGPLPPGVRDPYGPGGSR